MRKSAYFFLLLLFYSLIIPFIPKAFASDLTPTFLRLTRQSISQSSGGLLCATTPAIDNGTESSVQIIFSSGFTVNSTASNWTVDTSDIPSGSSAWPGISTATTVSGNTVTFPSTNLSASTQYCFNYNNTSTVTNPSSAGSYTTTIRTRNSSNTTLDAIDIGIPIIANDGIVVTATAPANPQDFQARLELISSGNGSFTQGTELTYRIVYGSYLNTSTGITVQAEWDLGIIQGSTIPTEDILDYVVGSASNAYNNTTPVVDTVNRTISWTINSIP